MPEVESMLGNPTVEKLKDMKLRVMAQMLNDPDPGLSPTSAPLLWITHFFTFLMFKKSLG